MAFRDLFRAHPRTPAQQRDHVRSAIFLGTIAGILLVVVAAVVVVSVTLARYAS